MIDTHTHLNFEIFKHDWEKVVERSAKAGLKAMIVIGTDLTSSARAIKLAEKKKDLFASVGIHPHHTQQFLISNDKLLINDQLLKLQIQKLRILARHPRVVAIGEIGLDYYHYKRTKYLKLKTKDDQKQLKNLQKLLFGLQIELAKGLGKPLIIHSREAGEEVLEVIEHFSKSDGQLPQGVWHCFAGRKKYLEKIIAAGFYISFTGNITYVKDRARVAKEVPLDRLLLETDCPFMPPFAKDYGRNKLPLEGKIPVRRRSEPQDVKILAQFHAKERRISLSRLINQTDKNAYKLFRGLLS